MVEYDELDEKLLDNFGPKSGCIVRKDLSRNLKEVSKAPNAVIEYLLGAKSAKFGASKAREVLKEVKEILARRLPGPDEGKKIESRIEKNGKGKIIDKISATFNVGKGIYTGKLANSGIGSLEGDKPIYIPKEFAHEYEKILSGGIWAKTELGYDPNNQVEGKSYPLYLRDLQPIQLSHFDREEIISKRKQFSLDEWLDILIRCIGFEPTSGKIDRRQKLFYISRLIPLVEENFNLLELGQKETGKSFAYRELSPYESLVSGTNITEARLFKNLNTGDPGLVALWDAVTFSEVKGLEFQSGQVIHMLKDYMQAGKVNRGGEPITGSCSLIFTGNIERNVRTLLNQGKTLFKPLPEKMKDPALLDRIHFYLPGWEVDKISSNRLTDHFGLSVDYFSEFLRAFRGNVPHIPEPNKYYEWTQPERLKSRDEKAIRNTVSGFVKILHPHGEVEAETIEEYLRWAIEMRKRVVGQLCRMDDEYCGRQFTYRCPRDGPEKSVSVPEKIEEEY